MSVEFDKVDEVLHALYADLKREEVEVQKEITPILKKLNKNDYERLLDVLSNIYYNEEDKIKVSDSLYDYIEEIYNGKFQEKNKKVGAIIRNNKVTKVKLPYPMFSLDKVKDDNALRIYKERYPESTFYIDDKLDGVSACYFISKGKRFLYKRGDENEGADITHLLEFLNIPEIKTDKDFAVRGELVMSLKNFSKYEQDRKNPRNTVSGLTNPSSKSIDKNMIKDIDFVAYQIMSDEKSSKQEQIETLKKLKFNVCEGTIFESEDLDTENLTIFTKQRKKRSLYDIDGLVVTLNKPNIKFPKDSNPKHQVAFKIQGDTAVAIVKDVEWNISKQGLYKPRVNIDPINLSGVTISWVTAHNAKFIVENGIGIGSKIIITRSGEVIPKILDVIEKVQPTLPDGIWNENNVELMVKEGDNDEETKDEITIKQITSFFSELGAKFLAETTIRKIYFAGFQTLKDFLNLTVDDIKIIEGFKDKSAERIINSITNSINNVPLYNVMAASCMFPNFGTKRLKVICESIPDVINITKKEDLPAIKNKILTIQGFKTLADIFVNNLLNFNIWLKNHNEIVINQEKEEKIEIISSDSKLKGQTIVFTGVRNALLQREIEKYGGRVTSAVSKQTTIVIVKDLDFSSVKVTKAQQNGARVIPIEEFAEEFGLEMD